MSDNFKKQNLMDWIAMSAEGAIVIGDGDTGGIWKQVERLFLANEYRIGLQEARFINILNDVNSEGSLGKMLAANPEVVGYPLSDIPYTLWVYDMLIIHAEIQSLATQNDMLETMLEQNKPSLINNGDHS
tara:strand:- start:306 stop:695 length:390 start_codon:yes stop_codon:yes gene_type:complete